MNAAVEVSSNKCSVVENPLSTLQIPSSIKDGMWEKAQYLSIDDSAIVSAPGSEIEWMIKSYSSEQPHYVNCQSLVVLLVMTSACLTSQ